MWNYNKPNFKNILDYVITNPYQAYIIELTNEKDTFYLYICLENAYLAYPFQFAIRIYDKQRFKYGICDFFVFSDYSEILNIDSSLKGLGSIMFYKIENLLKEFEIRKNVIIHKIIGSLSYIHKAENSWLKSIPFYCMKAYEYNYKISFNSNIKSYLFEKDNKSHDDQFSRVYQFAQKFSTETDSGSFIIYRT